jgi:hypothetical protein
MKRKISLLLVIAITVSCFAGCGNKKEEAVIPESSGSTLETAELNTETDTADTADESSSLEAEAGNHSDISGSITAIQDTVNGIIDDLYNSDYSYMQVGVSCNDASAELASYREEVNASGSLSDEYSEIFNDCVDEIISLTDFIAVSNATLENYVSAGDGYDGQNNAEHFQKAYEIWATSGNQLSELEAPAAVSDIWSNFNDSMIYYYEALKSFIKAMPNEGIEDFLAYLTGQSLISRYQVIFQNYYDMLSHHEESALIHQSYILDCLMNGFADTDASAVNVTCEMTDEIMPNLYPDMDSALNMSISTDIGTRDVLVSAEIEGFTQVYEQKITVTPEETFYMIKPAVATDLMDLETSRTTQFKFSVTDASTGEIIEQKTQPVTIESIYNISYMSNEFGTTDCNNFLAWITAESDSILQLRRLATEILGQTFGENYAMLPGYQASYGYSAGDIRIASMQAWAIQLAISEAGVRYNNGSYSFTGNQRVLMPDAVLSSGSGICIETSILMASALLSTGMHPLIIFTPGHAQVAVETWNGSGEYLLIETTALPFTSDMEVTDLITYYDSQGWYDYITERASSGNGITYVLDCSLQQNLGIKGLDYYA